MRIMWLRPLAGAVLACVLAACSDSPGSSLTASSEGNVIVAAMSTNASAVVSPSPSPSPSNSAGTMAPAAFTAPVPSPWWTELGSSSPSALLPGAGLAPASSGTGSSGTQHALADSETPLGDFSTFDFANGTKYPEQATLSVGPSSYLPGTDVAHVPITLDRPTPNTVIARVTTEDGGGLVRGVAGVNYTPIYKVVIFRPGDPLTQTVDVPILLGIPGADFIVRLVEAPWGGKMGTDRGTVQADFLRAPTPAVTEGFRAPRTFQPSATVQWAMSRETMKWSDAGHDKAWSTKLPNGRSQPGNQETGIYLDGWVYRDYGIEAPLRYTDDGLIMHTQVLKQPISWDGVPYNYGSIVLSGHNTRPLQIGYGQYEFTAKLPDRRGSWPAFWLISTAGWPPEIDIFEGFGFESWWDFDRYTAHTLHGGVPNSGTRTFQQGTFMNTDEVYGLSGFTTGFHTYAIDLQPDFITWFIDGRETYQAVNPFKGFRWYPIMDVAVKTTGPYDDGSGDMIVKDVKVYSN